MTARICKCGHEYDAHGRKRNAADTDDSRWDCLICSCLQFRGGTSS